MSNQSIQQADVLGEPSFAIADVAFHGPTHLAEEGIKLGAYHCNQIK
jgi:hypothetical protein